MILVAADVDLGPAAPIVAGARRATTAARWPGGLRGPRAGLMVAVVTAVALAAGPARAADQPAVGIQGAPGPADASKPTRPGLVVACDTPTPPRAANTAPINVVVNQATAWQPRGGEVLVVV